MLLLRKEFVDLALELWRSEARGTVASLRCLLDDGIRRLEGCSHFCRGSALLEVCLCLGGHEPDSVVAHHLHCSPKLLVFLLVQVEVHSDVLVQLHELLEREAPEDLVGLVYVKIKVEVELEVLVDDVDGSGPAVLDADLAPRLGLFVPELRLFLLPVAELREVPLPLQHGHLFFEHLFLQLSLLPPVLRLQNLSLELFLPLSLRPLRGVHLVAQVALPLHLLLPHELLSKVGVAERIHLCVARQHCR
mmetsp:Transcript_6870/g.28990  ORF Transcript_6870/g.28990 Transcript_6870/m.28990 type:complete len:248 (-) Transcript_6870:404-1147(-)